MKLNITIEMEDLKKIPLEFIEQPFVSDQKDAYRYLKKYSKLPIFADESITFAPDLKEIKELFHGVNMKLMNLSTQITDQINSFIVVPKV